MRAIQAAAENSATARTKALIPALPYPRISCGGERFVHPSKDLTVLSKRKRSLLTMVPKGPTLRFKVLAPRKDRISERMPIMKPFLRARFHAPQINDNVHPALVDGHGALKARAGQEQHGDGPAVWHYNRTPMAEVHGSGFGEQPRNGHAHAFLRSCALGAGRENDQPCAGSDALRGSNDRSGNTVAPATEQQSSFAYIANQIAVEAIRASAMAPSTSEALDIVGSALIRITYLSKNAEVNLG